MVLVNEAQLDGDFAARILIERDATGQAKIKKYQVWAVWCTGLALLHQTC